MSVSTQFSPLLWQNVNLDDPRQTREFMRQLIPYLSWLQQKLVVLINAPPPTGGGDMTKAVYDTNNNGIVDSCDALPYGRLTGVPSTFTPSAHAPTHLDNGSDPIPVATSTRTGSAPKLSGTATTFLNGTGVYSTPTGVTPAAHASTHLSAGTDPIAIATSVLAGLCPAVDNTTIQIVASKLSCVALAWSALTGVPSTFTPSLHHATHQGGGSDQIPLDTLGATTDITTLNSSTTAHGLLPKLPGTTTTFLRGDGAFAVVPGGGDMLKSTYDTDGNGVVDTCDSLAYSKLTAVPQYYEWTYPGGSP